MKEDKILKEIISDSAIHPAPEGFTESVMMKVRVKKAPLAYKPLISPLGQVLIGAFVILLTVLGILLGQESTEPTAVERWFSNLHFNLPELASGYTLPALAILAAVFFLIYFDARYQRRKYSLN